MKIRFQEDIKDCGLYVLQSLHKFYWKKWVDINFLKYESTYSEDGINITNLCLLASKIGLHTEAFKIEWEEILKLKTSFPLIAISKIDNFLHYVIIENISDNFVFTLDSTKGKRRIEIKQFKKQFTGLIIIVKKQQECNQKNIYEKFFSFKFKLNLKSLVIGVLFSFITIFLNFLLSFINKNIFASIQQIKISEGQKTIMFFFWISMVLLVVSLLNNFLLTKLKNLISATIKEQFINSIEGAEYKQILKISKNEILLRYLSIESIAGFLSFMISFISSFLFSIILVIPLLFFIKIKFILIVILVNIIKTLVSYFINDKISYLSKKLTQKSVEEINKLSFIVKNEDSYGLILWENLEKQSFLNNIKSYKNVDLNINKLSSIKNLILRFLNLMTTIIIYCFFLLQKTSNLSQLFFILQIQTIISEPSNNLQEFFIGWKIFKNGSTRLNFIINIPQSRLRNSINNIIDLKTIKFKGLCFGFERRNIINDLNFIIDKGAKLQGPNGSGKSTLFKLLSGFYSNYKGSIIFNNIEIKEINKSWFKEKIYFSGNEFNMPNIDLYTYLFSDVNNKEKEKILKDTDFISVINSLNINIFSNLLLNSNKFSMGQKQIIKLLPLLIKKYQLVLLDESFEFLSQQMFELISRLICKKQENCIIIETSHNKRFLLKNSPTIFLKK
ncbi:Mbov_0121 family peptidase domain-containing ABC transporter [Mycoplasma sp. 3398]